MNVNMLEDLYSLYRQYSVVTSTEGDVIITYSTATIFAFFTSTEQLTLDGLASANLRITQCVWFTGQVPTTSWLFPLTV